jgi:polyhydroxyalkanoate synthesis regulator phasin
MAGETIESAEAFVDTLLDAGMETAYGEITEYQPERMAEMIRQRDAAVRRAALVEVKALLGKYDLEDIPSLIIKAENWDDMP